MMWRNTLLLAICASIALACGGAPTSGSGASVHRLIDDVINAMEQVNSYEVSMDLGEGPEQPHTLLIEFQAPDRYRNLSYYPRRRETRELIRIADQGYERTCDEKGRNCGEWSRTETLPLPIIGPSSAFMPGWPLVAFEMTSNLRSENDGEDIRVMGSVNAVRAILENLKRVADDLGVTAFGEECSSAVTPVVGSGEPPNGETPATPDRDDGALTCRARTYEELLEQEAEDLAFFDEHPATIDATISEDDSLVRRIVITIPPRPIDDDGSEQITFEYSRYNDVTIEAPAP